MSKSTFSARRLRDSSPKKVSRRGRLPVSRSARREASALRTSGTARSAAATRNGQARTTARPTIRGGWTASSVPSSTGSVTSARSGRHEAVKRHSATSAIRPEPATRHGASDTGATCACASDGTSSSASRAAADSASIAPTAIDSLPWSRTNSGVNASSPETTSAARPDPSARFVHAAHTPTVSAPSTQCSHWIAAWSGGTKRKRAHHSTVAPGP